VRGQDPVHFDPHLTRHARTHSALSFVYSKLLRHKVGADVRPGTFIVEPDLAERWEVPDDTTYVFHLRQGVKWHNKPPVNGRELVAEDVQFTFERFLTEKGNPERQLLESVDRVEVVDRYTVKFHLKEPFVWLRDILASAICMWIIALEVVQQYGDLKKVETAIGTGPFILERYEPNVKTVFKRNPEYFRPGLPYPEARKQLIFEIQRYAAEQQYYIYLSSQVITSSRQPYMKNYAHNLTADFGSRVAALWLDDRSATWQMMIQSPL
jgi:peptide/nickel transport system substrate-binding protein